MGYAAYEARRARERSASQPGWDPQAPLRELARVNDEMAACARDANDRLRLARETLRRGLKG